MDIKLKPLTQEDVDKITEIHNNPLVLKEMGVRPYYNWSDDITKSAQPYSQFQTQIKGIYFEGELTGAIEIIYHHNKHNISYFIHPDFQGRGIGKQAIQIILKDIPESIDQLCALVFTSNVRSKRMLENNGFENKGFYDPKNDLELYVLEV